MTYDGFAVYRKYLAYKLHFTTDKYDYTEHSGMVHTKLETFTKRNDRYMFHKLSVKYNQDEIDDFMIANFVKKNKAWSGSLLERDSHDTYLQYKKRKEGFNYWLNQLSGGHENRSEVLMGFAESSENKTIFSNETNIF